MIIERRTVGTRSLRIVVMLVILASLLAGRQAAAFHEETVVDQFSTNIYTYHFASRTDGSMIVWNALGPPEGPNNAPPFLIMGASVEDREPFVIAETPLLSTPPAVDGEIVVWTEDTYESNASVVGTNLVTGDPFTVATSEQSVDGLAVSDGWVVWRSSTLTSSSIRARNLYEPSEPITLAKTAAGPDGLPLGMPRIADGWIVWTESLDPEYTGYNRLVALRAGETEPAVVLDTEHLPSFDLDGGRLVYPGISPGGPNRTSVLPTHIVDLETGTTRTISMTTPYASGGAHVAIDGRYVYRSYVTRLGGSSGQDYQLLAYDLDTDSVFPVLNSTSYSLDVQDGVLTWVPSCLCSTRIVVATTMDDRLPTAPVPDTRLPDPGWAYQPETGHYLQYGFKGFWEGNGGMPVFGHPLTEEYVEQNDDTGEFYTVQYFERQRFEWHPEHTGTPYDILLGRLGVDALELQGRDWTTFPKADPTAPNYVSQTGHAIAERFYAYWSSHGLEFGDDGISYRESLALFGYPISEPMMETNADGDTVLTQYFERAVFEHHPDNPAEYQVLLRRVGAEVLDVRGW